MMPKRFTDTLKWQDEWFMELPWIYKLFYLYILDNCDHAGIWKVNFKLASFHIGHSIDQDSSIKFFEGRILEFKPGYWFILKFIDFQYGGIKNDAVGKSISKILKINNLEGAKEGLSRGYQAPKDKDKVKVKDKVLINNGKKFEYNEILTLPFQYIESIQMQLYATLGRKLEQDKIETLWEGFRLEKLDGKTWYNSENDFYKHFVNWIKKQKFEQPKLTKSQQDEAILREHANRYS